MLSTACCGSSEDLLRAFHRLGDRIGRHMVGQPEFDGALGGDPGAGQRVLLGQQQADVQRPGQRAAVGGHQPNLHMRVGQVGVFGDVDDVAQRDQAAAQSDGRAVDRRHHRHPAPGHAQHDLASVSDRLGPQVGVARQFVEIGEVAAGRERPAGTGYHRGAGTAVVAHPLPQLRQPVVQVVVDRVERVGPVQRDDPQRPVGLDVDFGRHVVHVRLPIPRFVRR